MSRDPTGAASPTGRPSAGDVSRAVAHDRRPATGSPSREPGYRADVRKRRWLVQEQADLWPARPCTSFVAPGTRFHDPLEARAEAVKDAERDSRWRGGKILGKFARKAARLPTMSRNTAVMLCFAGQGLTNANNSTQRLFENCASTERAHRTISQPLSPRWLSGGRPRSPANRRNRYTPRCRGR